MIGTRKDLFEAIRGVLADQVLAELKPATWMAANIRACITLLTYLEDLVEMDRGAYLDANAAMRTLLGESAARAPVWLDASGREQAGALSKKEVSADGPVAGLDAENHALKSLLVQIIRQHGAAARSGGADHAFQHALRVCLLAVTEREFAVDERASKLPPF